MVLMLVLNPGSTRPKPGNDRGTRETHESRTRWTSKPGTIRFRAYKAPVFGIQTTPPTPTRSVVTPNVRTTTRRTPYQGLSGYAFRGEIGYGYTPMLCIWLCRTRSTQIRIRIFASKTGLLRRIYPYLSTMIVSDYIPTNPPGRWIRGRERRHSDTGRVRYGLQVRRDIHIWCVRLNGSGPGNSPPFL